MWEGRGCDERGRCQQRSEGSEEPGWMPGPSEGEGGVGGPRQRMGGKARSDQVSSVQFSSVAQLCPIL